MTLDDGVITFFALSTNDDETDNRGNAVISRELIATEYFGELGIRNQEYFAANANKIEILRRARIWQNKKVTSGQVAIIDDNEYNVGRVYHGKDEDGLPITDISLEEPEKIRGGESDAH